MGPISGSASSGASNSLGPIQFGNVTIGGGVGNGGGGTLNSGANTGSGVSKLLWVAVAVLAAAAVYLYRKNN